MGKKYCSIIQCENNRGVKDDRICLFSSVQDTKNQWREALNKLGLQHAGSVANKISVCMLHFHPDDILKTYKKLQLRPGAVPSFRTRPFDPLWKSRDKREALGNGAQLESIETVNCEPMIVVDESIASVSYNNSNESQATDDLIEYTVIIENDDVMLENHETTTKSKSITEENRKSRARSELKSFHSISSGKLCEICFTTMTVKEFKRHLCLNTTIACEYCTDAIFITTLEMREHLSNAHADLIFHKCDKCTLAFPMRKLLEIHEKTDPTHWDEVSDDDDDFDESPMHKLYACQFCDISMSDPRELGLHMKYHHRRRQQPFKVSKKVDSIEDQTKISKYSKKYCKIISCEYNRGTNDERLLLFCAKDPDVNDKWRDALTTLKLPHPSTGLMHICMLHFHPDDINKGKRWSLRPGAVPSIKPLITLDLYLEAIKKQSDEQNQFSSPTPIIFNDQTEQKSCEKCSICCNSFARNELLESHICGDDDDTLEVSCEYCDQTFQSLAKCTEHLETVHVDDRTMYQCRKCPRIFGMMLLKDYHEKFYPHVMKSYQCDKCAHKFSTKYKIRNHMENVHLGKVKRPFLCSECGKSFTSKRSLQNHMLLHGDPTIQCPECPAKFYRQQTFENHYQWHQKLIYKCNECNHTCSMKASLRRHIKITHNKEPKKKKFGCPFCDVKFHKSNNLKTHLRSHTGEKPFECEFCHNFYRYKGDLMKHMQIHVGDNLYECDVCEQGFRYHVDFKRHSFEHYKEDKEKRNEATQSSSDTVQTK